MDLALSATIQHERRKIAWARSHLAGTEASIRRSNVFYSINISNSVSAIVLRPLEKLLQQVRKMASTIFKSVTDMAETMKEEGNHDLEGEDD